MTKQAVSLSRALTVLAISLAVFGCNIGTQSSVDVAELAGVDSNSNGIRDDVDRLISTIEATEYQRQRIDEYARVIQEAVITGGSDEKQVRSLAARSDQAVVCLSNSYNSMAEVHQIVMGVRELTTDTRVRARSYYDYNRVRANISVMFNEQIRC
ncbi:hypothetical protein [Vibrio mediterranei]|uniref:hypothetical protein n=1 Tax=Vibrio mediterranei TaxID=689 RepID=UPI004068B352